MAKIELIKKTVSLICTLQINGITISSEEFGTYNGDEDVFIPYDIESVEIQVLMENLNLDEEDIFDILEFLESEVHL